MALDGSRCLLRDLHCEIQYGSNYDFAVLSGVCDPTGRSRIDDENYVTLIGRMPVRTGSDDHYGQRQFEGYVFITSALTRDPEIWAMENEIVTLEAQPASGTISGQLTPTPRIEDHDDSSVRLRIEVTRLPIVQSSTVLAEIKNRHHQSSVPALADWSP